MKMTISILGCGWLGLPLGRFLVNNGFPVKGSTTTPSKISALKQSGIQPFIIRLNPDIEIPDVGFFHSDILIVCLPPGRGTSTEGFYPLIINNLHTFIINSGVQKVIFISSTSVYPESNAIMYEDDVQHCHEAKNKVIGKAEDILKSNNAAALIILRCGGLMGYNRIPGKYFAGKKGLLSGKKPVNYIHGDDVIHIIFRLLATSSGTYNLVAPRHPLRQEVYNRHAKLFGFVAPEFVMEDEVKYKIVDSNRIIKKLNYNFIYPDPLSFF